MKKVICILLILFVVVFIAACDLSIDVTKNFDNEHFTVIYRTSHYVILQHNDTGVCYLWTYPKAYISGLTVMLNADGTPLTEWNP